MTNHETQPTDDRDPFDILRRVTGGGTSRGKSILFADNLDAYAAGQIEAHEIRCALCGKAPCACPEFGTEEYFELINRRHGTSFKRREER